MNPSESSVPSSNDLDPHPERSGVLSRLFAKNPFYIISAGLLLYSIYRLSIDPKLFATELSQLFFNFGSLQVYELLLVGTALFLARRAIWYDASLLVSLESLFLFVPFILISQALLNEGSAATILCGGATVLALTRFVILRRGFTRLNFPRSASVLGVALLTLNLCLPLLVQYLHKDANTLGWESRGGGLVNIVCLFVMPILFALPNFLPHTTSRGNFLVECRYFPASVTLLWSLATATHAYSLGYVYGVELTLVLAAPAICALAFTLWNRLDDFDFLRDRTAADLKAILLATPILVTVITAFSEHPIAYTWVTAMNGIAYLFAGMRKRNRNAFNLSLVCVAILGGILLDGVNSAPQNSGSRVFALFAAVGLYTLARAILSSDARLGIVGGAIAAIGGAIMFREESFLLHMGLQMGLVFTLLHSARWNTASNEHAHIVRILIAVVYALHSLVWLIDDDLTAMAAVSSLAVAVIAVYIAIRCIFGFWASRVILGSAVGVLFGELLLKSLELVKTTPPGVIALVGSFILFAAGTVAALTREKWNRPKVTMAKL